MTTATINARGPLSAETHTSAEGVRFRIDNARDGAFWCDLSLTLTQLRDLVSECESLAEDERDGQPPCPPGEEDGPRDWQRHPPTDAELDTTPESSALHGMTPDMIDETLFRR